MIFFARENHSLLWGRTGSEKGEDSPEKEEDSVVCFSPRTYFSVLGHILKREG